MKILKNDKDWRDYKYNQEYCTEDINWNHMGEPKKFPCWVMSREVGEQTFNASSRIDLQHEFLYTEDFSAEDLQKIS